jgi:hypothetical protein
MDGNQAPPAAPQPEVQNKDGVKEIHYHHHYDRSPFGLWRFFWGLLVIFIGLVFLAQSLGIINGVDVGQFFAGIWPVFIIFIGISILFRGGGISSISAMILLLLAFALMASLLFSPPNSVFGRMRTTMQNGIKIDNWQRR